MIVCDIWTKSSRKAWDTQRSVEHVEWMSQKGLLRLSKREEKFDRRDKAKAV